MIDRKVESICRNYVENYCKDCDGAYKEAFIKKMAEITKDEIVIDYLVYREFVKSLTRCGTLSRGYPYEAMEDIKEELKGIVVSCSQEE